MKVFAISDLHLGNNVDKPMDVFGWVGHFDKIKADWIEKVGEEDVVLLCGDLSWAMKLEDAIDDIMELNKLPGKKIMIKGNHDLWWNSLSKVRAVLPSNIEVLQHTAINLGNIIVCGTRGWTLPEISKDEHDLKVYNTEIERTKLALENAVKLRKNDEKIIMMFHYPPYSFIEGETDYTSIVRSYGVNTVLYGHLHGKEYKKIPLIREQNGVKYYLTSCDILDNKLMQIDI